MNKGYRGEEMTFWSSQKLEANLAKLTDYPDKAMVDCNALTLRVGGEIYVTPGLEQPVPNAHTKKQLKPDEAVTIPPGQFAFLLTEERITIPPELMGFISIKATYKLKGLVNVSGFHVDPGWSGPLIFTVYNAGPATIHLQRGLDVFLLWIANLDAASKKRKIMPAGNGIPPAIINNITGVVDSMYALEKRMKEDVKAVGDKQEAFRTEVAELKERQGKILFYFGIAAIIATAIMTLVLKMVADHFFTTAPTVTAAQIVPPPIAAAPAAPAARAAPAAPAATLDQKIGSSTKGSDATAIAKKIE
jgi:dCTP deaminase